MRRGILLTCLLLGGNLTASPTQAASLFGTEGLDPKFCEQPTFRQSVLYIDDMMMVDGRIEWASKLATKLKATLAPGERVTVVRLSPGSGQSQEVWSGCWPAYTSDERAKLAAGTYLFRRNPLNDILDQQKLFLSGLSGALGSIYMASKRPAETARIDPAAPPEKNILRALVSDEARFAHSQTTTRAIVYSDLAENSDLGSVFHTPAQSQEDLGDKLGTHLRQSVFYDYGLGEDIVKSPALADNIRAFWVSALRSMVASIGGLGADLNVANEVPVAGYIFAVEVQHAGQSLEGKLSILTASDGTLVDSWISISRLSITALAGSFRCQGGGDDAGCRLDAQTGSGLTTNSATESLSLKGSLGGGFKGHLGVPGALTDPVVASKPER